MSQVHPDTSRIRADTKDSVRTKSAALTLRVSQIPKAISVEEFISSLEAFVDKITPGKEKSGEEAIMLSSFAPSATSADSEKECVATVTLREMPPELKSGGQMDLGLSLPVIADTHFYGLTPLNNPTEITVDIVAVTGLAGHAFGSWKSRNAGTMWLRDFLPISVPNARIMTYGYDSGLVNSESNFSISDFAGRFLETLKTARGHEKERHRPIIFIGHSLGGLVIKHALVQAGRGIGGGKEILYSCYGLLLFGVPNGGLDVDGLRAMVKGQPNSRLVNDLDPESECLRLLHDAFCDYFTFKDSRIISIRETKQTKTVKKSLAGNWERTGTSVQMVTRLSAIYSGPSGRTDEELSIDADHSNIVKFSDKNNTDFKVIRDKIVHLIREAPGAIKKRLIPLQQNMENQSYSSLRQVIESGEVSMVWLLVEQGADLSQHYKDGWTPLAWAAQNGHEPMVQLLIEKGADPDYESSSHWTPLARAIDNGHERVAKLLIEKGANPNKHHADGWTPLQYAARTGLESMALMLLGRGADIDHESSSHWTPLLRAISYGHKPMVRLLIEKGVNPSKKYGDGWTPLDWAVHKGYEPMRLLLLELGAVGVS